MFFQHSIPSVPEIYNFRSVLSVCRPHCASGTLHCRNGGLAARRHDHGAQGWDVDPLLHDDRAHNGIKLPAFQHFNSCGPVILRHRAVNGRNLHASPTQHARQRVQVRDLLHEHEARFLAVHDNLCDRVISWF